MMMLNDIMILSNAINSPTRIFFSFLDILGHKLRGNKFEIHFGDNFWLAGLGQSDQRAGFVVEQQYVTSFLH